MKETRAIGNRNYIHVGGIEGITSAAAPNNANSCLTPASFAAVNVA